MRTVARGVPLSDEALGRGLTLATESPDARAWRVFLSQALLVLGAALCLAGVVCFIAFNWSRIGRFGKFGAIELAIIASALVAWRRIPKLSGEIALLAAAVLVGPLLAVFGQTYQTGADPYGLFGMWLLIIVPWVVASRLSATWVLALALLDTTIILYWTQVIGTRDTRDAIWLPLSIGVLQFAALAAWEWQRRLPAPWLTERWAQRLIAIAGLSSLWIAAAVFIVSGLREGGGAIAGVILFLAAVGTTFWYYRRVQADRFMVAVAVIAAMLLATLLAGKILFDVLRVGLIGGMLLAALIVWQITLGLKWYRRSTP